MDNAAIMCDIAAHSLKSYIPSPQNTCLFCLSLGVEDNLHVLMPKKKVPVMNCNIFMLRLKCCLDTVDLEIPLFVPNMPLVTIPRR